MVAVDAEHPERRSDGAQTHATIVEAAMRLASIEGLGSLTFGRLARDLGITKSGVFAHFRSKEHLQQETIEAALVVFDREVVAPAFSEPEGLARLLGLCEAYLSYVERGVFPGGCFLAQLLAEFDAPDGSIHDALVAGYRDFLGVLAHQVEVAQARGELDEALDADQMAFELYAPIELANYLFVLFRDPGHVERGRAAVATTVARARSDEPTTSAVPRPRPASTRASAPGGS